MVKKLKGGIIGAGKTSFIGFVHISAASLFREAEIISGVFSRDPEKSIRRGMELGIKPDRAYTDYKAMVKHELSLPDDERIDFVIIASPNSSHYEISMTFLNAGFNVFSDKPMAVSLSQCREIKEAAEKNRKLFALTHGYTGYPMIKQARHIIKKGHIGKILRVVVEYTQGWLSPLIEDPENFQTWHLDPDISGPSCTMMDVGIHALNLVQTVTGLTPLKVCADLNADIPNNPLDDTGSVLIHYSGNVRGILHASQVSSGEGNALRIRIYGTAGGISWDQEFPEVLEKMNTDSTSTIYKKGCSALCSEALEASNLPGGHPEGLICAFANIYRSGFRTIRSSENGESGEEAVPGYDYPDAEQGITGLAFIEAILKNSSSGEKWTKL